MRACWYAGIIVNVAHVMSQWVSRCTFQKSMSWYNLAGSKGSTYEPVGEGPCAPARPALPAAMMALPAGLAMEVHGSTRLPGRAMVGFPYRSSNTNPGPTPPEWE